MAGPENMDDKITSYWKNRNRNENDSGSSKAAKTLDEFIKKLNEATTALEKVSKTSGKIYEEQQRVLDAKRKFYEEELKKTEELKKSILTSIQVISDEADDSMDEFIKNLKKQLKDVEVRESQAKNNLNAVNRAEQSVDDSSPLANLTKRYTKMRAASRVSSFDPSDIKALTEASKSGMTEALEGTGGQVLENAVSSGSSATTAAVSKAAGAIGVGLQVLSTIGNYMKKIHDKLDGSVDDAMNILAANTGEINARLYGDVNQTSLSKLVEQVNDTVKASPFISKRTMIDNISTLVKEGIDYNIEQRALLMTLNDKLVPTFNALDGTLTRLVRVQQADITLAQMGAEARLNEFLNEQFRDTSYLNQLYDSVYSALADSMSAQTDTDQATQYAYAVQKWLGALYSVGLSDQAVQGIANALNALGTGDIAKIGDQGQTLLALAANRAGISYAGTLTEGLSADDTNKLLKSMVEYLRDISTNTSSNVVKSQWGDILNLELADWRAIRNITDEDITNVFNEGMSQKTAQDYIANIVGNGTLKDRYTIAEFITTAIDNAMTGFGLDIANDSTKYLSWKISTLVTDLSESVFGGGSLIGTIVNLGAGVYDLVTFIDDYAKLFENMAGAVSGYDTAFGDILAGYEFTMTRGGAGTGSNVSTSTSLAPVTIASQQSNTVELEEAINGSYGLHPADENSPPPSGRGGRKSEYVEEDSGLTYFEQEVLSGLYEEPDYSEEEELNEEYWASDVGVRIGTSAADKMLTTFQQQEDAVSATSRNIWSSEDNVLIRDINDLYAELFERQSTPIRVTIAKVEEQGQIDLHLARIDSIDDMIHGTVSVSVEGDAWSSINGMRNS